MEDVRKPNYELAESDYMSGMKYKDIAEKYNVTINTVKSWKQRYDWNKGKKSVHTKEKKVCTQKKPKNAKKETVQGEVAQVEENSELTDKQRLFCLFYSKSFNATQSYLKAYGCDWKTANANGSRLLVNASVKKEINQLQGIKRQQIMITEADMVEYHMRIAFADMGDYVSFGQEEVPYTIKGIPVMNPDGTPKTVKYNFVSLNDSSNVDTQLIKEIKEGKEGVSIKLIDRCNSMEWLDRYFLMNPLDRHKIEYENKKLKIETKEKEVNIAALKEKSNSGSGGNDIVRAWAEKVMKSRQNPYG